MKRYKVTYSEHSIREIDVEANSAEEAEDLVRSGSVDCDDSHEIDVELCDICGSEELGE
jgi:hypothetical protein